MILFAIVLVVWTGICAIWAGLLIAQIRAGRNGLFLEARPESSKNQDVHDSPTPTVCVVIPARNESSQIAPCLASVLAQKYPSLEVLLVDDRSSDDTSAVALRLAVSDSRLRVLRINSLPPGWLGKSHALWEGTREITSDWILFLDADCILEPTALRASIAEATRRGAGLMTLWPRNRAESFWEHLLIPLCAGIIALWYGSNRVNAPASPLAFANGQFLLIRRSDYERIGGHRMVRHAIIEDIPLAEAAKQAGVRCHVASGCELFSVRMYPSYSAIRAGWSRIYVGALRSGLKVAASLAWLALGSLLPFIAALVLFIPPVSTLARTEMGTQAFVALRWCCGLHLALLLVVSYRFWGFGACRRSYLFLYPLTVILVMQILWLAWWRLALKRSIVWSTTAYRINGKGMIIE